MKDSKEKKGLDLQWKILIGIIGGIILGIIFNNLVGPGVTTGPIYTLKIFFKYGGDIFIRLLRMMIVPLVFASLFMAVANLGDIRELGKIGGKTVAYYMATTALAVLLGIILVNIIHPGQGIDREALSAMNIVTEVPDKVSKQGVGDKSSAIIIIDTLVNMIPKNPAEALATGDVLQIIFFTIFFAIMAAMVGRRVRDLDQGDQRDGFDYATGGDGGHVDRALLHLFIGHCDLYGSGRGGSQSACKICRHRLVGSAYSCSYYPSNPGAGYRTLQPHPLV